VGYYEAAIIESEFVVEPAAERSALAALLTLSRDEFGYDLDDRGLTDLDGFMRLFEIRVVRDEDGVIRHLAFAAQLLLETDDVFRALGPYVRAGSYVRMHSGTGARWRYEFDGAVTRRHDEPDAPWYGR
jgi:hypothetical protein